MGLLARLAVLFAAVSPSLVACEAAESDPAVPRISSISFSGNGCSKDPRFSGNFNDPTFTFQNFAATLPGANQTVNCQAHIQTTGASPGWQVAVKSNTVKGHVTLAPGTRLDYYTTVYFSEDASRTDTSKGTIENTGSTTINQAVTLVTDAGADEVWSPCADSSGYTGILNVNFRAALSGDGKAYFEALTENWDVEWRRC
ncbi:hypothetical protein VTK56DRAFT_1703 [Thermocarpiscus australiensis]